MRRRLADEEVRAAAVMATATVAAAAERMRRTASRLDMDRQEIEGREREKQLLLAVKGDLGDKGAELLKDWNMAVGDVRGMGKGSGGDAVLSSPSSSHFMLRRTDQTGVENGGRTVGGDGGGGGDSRPPVIALVEKNIGEAKSGPSDRAEVAPVVVESVTVVPSTAETDLEVESALQLMMTLGKAHGPCDHSSEEAAQHQRNEGQLAASYLLEADPPARGDSRSAVEGEKHSKYDHAALLADSAVAVNSVIAPATESVNCSAVSAAGYSDGTSALSVAAVTGQLPAAAAEKQNGNDSANAVLTGYHPSAAAAENTAVATVRSGDVARTHAVERNSTARHGMVEETQGGEGGGGDENVATAGVAASDLRGGVKSSRDEDDGIGGGVGDDDGVVGAAVPHEQAAAAIQEADEAAQRAKVRFHFFGGFISLRDLLGKITVVKLPW